MKKIGQRAKNVSVMKLDQYSNEKSKYMTLAEFLPSNAIISKSPRMRLLGLCIEQQMSGGIMRSLFSQTTNPWSMFGPQVPVMIKE